MEEHQSISNSNQCYQNPVKTHLLNDLFSQKNLIEWPLKVNFKGLNKPHKKWEDWVEKMSIKNAKIWEITGICDGLLSSLHEIKPNVDNIIGLCEFWCPETNSFMFPWGEATITLEDVNVLAGLPVFGQSVNLCLTGDLSKNLDEKLHKVWSNLCMSTSDKRPTYEAWLKHFNEENGIVEHVGFLAFWLSRFVFPDLDDKVVGKHVFPIAVNLAQRVKIALAPAVLASLYQNLTFLTQSAAYYDSRIREVSIAGPFWILQFWAIERFPLLGSKLAKPLSFGQLRIARWDKVSLDVKLVDVRSTLWTAEEFCWRPYEKNSSGFRDDDELKALNLCVQPHKLIGIGCSEMYCPHRVTKQFKFNCEITEETASCIPSESNHVSLAGFAGSSELCSIQKCDDMSNKSTSVSLDAVVDGVKQQAGVDNEKPVLTAGNIAKAELDCHNESHLKTMPSIEDSKPVLSGGDIAKSELNMPSIDDSKLVLTAGDIAKAELNCHSDSHSKTMPSIEDTKPVLVVSDIAEGELDYHNKVLPKTAQESTDIEIIDASSSGKKRARSTKPEDPSLVCLVILDSDEVTEKLVHKNHFSRSAKKAKKRFGDTACYPLYVADGFGKMGKSTKRSGISIDHPIDVDAYYY